MTRLAVLLPVIAGACWGSSGVFVRVLYKAGFDNVTITFSRVAVTLVLLGLATMLRDRGLFRIRKRDVPLLILNGFAGYFFFNLCYNVAIHTLSMSMASILLSTAPAYVLVMSAILFRERITRRKVLCMLGALLGCFLMSGIIESGGLRWSIFGLLMGVCSALCSAATTLSVNELVDKRHMHPLTLQFYTCLTAFLIMLPMADHVQIGQFVADRPVYGIVFMLGHALVVSLIPNLLHSMSFRYVDSGVVAILASGAEPTSALLFGLIVYAEIPTVPGTIGMVMVVVSMIVLSRSDSRQSEEES